MDINSCLFQGTLKDDPEMTYTQNGTARTKLTLVIEEGKRSQWIPIVLWAEVAEEAAEFLAANQRLRVPDARFTSWSFDDQKTGEKIQVKEFTSERIEYQGKEANGSSQKIDPDNLPF